MPYPFLDLLSTYNTLNPSVLIQKAAFYSEAALTISSLTPNMSSHRRRAGTREAFLRDVPSYSGTDKDFESSHYKSYGREEKLGPDGKHHHGSNHFPRGSDREQMHTQYTKSTRPRDDSRAAYHNGVIAAQKELGRMSAEEQKYYRTQTGGFAPHQHERLDPRAAQFRDDSLK